MQYTYKYSYFYKCSALPES